MLPLEAVLYFYLLIIAGPLVTYSELEVSNYNLSSVIMLVDRWLEQS